MNVPYPFRQPLAIRYLVAPMLRLVLAISLLLSLLAYKLIHLSRKINGQKSDPKTIDDTGTRKPAMHMGNALAALRLTKEIADKCGAKPFLISGTLLGIHRNGALLAHDYDVDLGIFADDPSLIEFVDCLRAAPEVVRISEKRLGAVGRIANPWIPKLRDDVILYKINVQSLPDTKPVRLDLFVHFRVHGFVAHGSTRTLWLNSEFNLNEIELQGAHFHAPADRVRYLSENYGDFSVPKLNFESSIDCPNWMNILTFQASLALAAKWAMFKERRDEPRRALIKIRLAHYFLVCCGARPESHVL